MEGRIIQYIALLGHEEERLSDAAALKKAALWEDHNVGRLFC